MILPRLPRAARRAALGIVLVAVTGAAPAQPPSPALAPPSVVDPYAGVRAEFRAAYGLAGVGLPVSSGAFAPAATADSDALRAYPLYPYLQALRLQRRLRANAEVPGLDTDIATYFTGNGDALAGRDLRRAWLNNLARRQVWTTFAENYVDGVADAGLRCHALNARIQTRREEGVAAAALEAYQNGQTEPACTPVFAWLDGQRLLGPVSIDKRARALLKAGNWRAARDLAVALPPAQAAPIVEWSRLIENPQGEIDSLIAQPQRAVEPEALLDGWTRLARKDTEAAAARLRLLRSARKLDEHAVSPLAAALGLALSWNRDPDAGTYFVQVLPADVDEKVAEWSARSALWRGDWKTTDKVIAAMPAATRTTQRWRYWGARAAETRSDAEARTAYMALADEDGWYPALASMRLGRAYAPHGQALTFDANAIDALATQAAFVRAHELLLANLRNYAGAEWLQGLDGLDGAQRREAIGLAARWSWWDMAVATASRQAVYNDYALLYPLPYDAEVRKGAELSGLPEALIYAVIRQESLYRPDAISKANARGLMQLLDETARRTAKRNDRSYGGIDALYDPAVNVPIGALHLQELVARFRGAWTPAIAGYNAGPNAAARWLPDASIDADIWIENIPYNETRTYVQRVAWHSLVFAWRRSGEAQKLDQWLAPLGPAPGAATAADEPQ